MFRLMASEVIAGVHVASLFSMYMQSKPPHLVVKTISHIAPLSEVFRIQRLFYWFLLKLFCCTTL